jgi:HD superfamily phosphohydrolase
MIDEESLVRAGISKVETFAQKYFRKRQACKELEENIASKAKVKYRDVIVFCHDPDMNMKTANALVSTEAKEPQRLREVSDEFKRINDRHARLWRFYVFAHVDAVEPVAAAMQKIFPNYRNKWPLAERLSMRKGHR